MQKNVVLSTAAVVALAVAGYLVFANSGTGVEIAGAYNGTAYSFSANEVVNVKYDLGDEGPYTCPKTGDKSAYLMYFCMDCQHRVVPNLVKTNDGNYHYPHSLVCPNCGSGNLVLYDPTLPEQSEAELTLPKEHP